MFASKRSCSATPLCSPGVPALSGGWPWPWRRRRQGAKAVVQEGADGGRRPVGSGAGGRGQRSSPWRGKALGSAVAVQLASLRYTIFASAGGSQLAFSQFHGRDGEKGVRSKAPVVKGFRKTEHAGRAAEFPSALVVKCTFLPHRDRSRVNTPAPAAPPPCPSVPRRLALPARAP